jgi:hypothetical protein
MKKIGLLLILLLASPAVAQPAFDDLHGSWCSNQRDLLDVLSDQQLLWTEGRGEPGSVLSTSMISPIHPLVIARSR